MDDFEKNYPGFDWKNIPAYKHPGGRNCPCPKHEFMREQSRTTAQAIVTGKKWIKPRISLCPEHYKLYFEEALPSLPLKRRIAAKIVLKLNMLLIIKLSYMESDKCYFCRFGTGGVGKKKELPPM